MKQFLQRAFDRMLSRSLVDPSADSFRALLGARAGAVPVNRPAEQVVMVYGCLQARVEAIASVPLRISDAEGNLIDDGDVVRLLEKPNAEMSWETYIRVLETHLTLYNTIAILPVGDGPDELIPLNPAGLKPIDGVHTVAGTPVVMGWDYLDPTTGASKRFAANEIVVHRGFNPHAPLAALAPMTVATQTIKADQTARAQNIALLEAGGTPPYYLFTDKALTSEQADEVLSKWEDRNDSFFARKRPKVTWGGLKVEKLGLSPHELEYLEGLKFHRHDYYIIFRVAPAMVWDLMGETGLSQGSSTNDQKVAWWSDVGLSELNLIAGIHEQLIAPLARRTAAKGRRGLSRMQHATFRRRLQRAGREAGRQLYIWFDDNVIPALVEHRLGKIEQFDKILARGYSPDEINDWLDLGLPPHPTNQATLPFGVQPAGDVGRAIGPVQREDSPPEAQRRGDVDSAFEVLERALTVAQVDPTAEPEPEPLPAKYQALRAKMDAMIAEQERAAARKWSRYFLEQRGRVLERVKEFLSREDGDTRPALSRSRVDDLISLVFPLGEENELLLRRMTDLWVAQMESGWNLLNEQAGRTTDSHPFRIEDPRIQEAIRSRTIQGSKVNETSERELRAILEESIDEGLNATQIGDRIAEYYAENIGESAARPQTAARTQTAGIVNDGQLASAKDVGGLKKIWIHGGANDPRPAHIRAQGIYANGIPVEEKFEINGELMDAPGDAAADVSETANCTCMVGFVPVDQ